MAAGKEIRGKIKSVENTKKITKAMEMVAASKMRKAQERMRSARPYSEKIRTVSAHLAQANPEYTHPFLVKHEKSKKIGIIVITTGQRFVRWFKHQRPASSDESDERVRSSRKQSRTRHDG